MITIKRTNYGHGTNRCVYDGDNLIATINKFNFREIRLFSTVQDTWNVCWCNGRVDWHGSYTDARNNALKGN